MRLPVARRPRVLLLMATRTYRAKAFLTAAARLGLDVTVGSEREHVLASRVPGAAIALDFQHPRDAARQIESFAQTFPVDAVVGVDDDTSILAAQAAERLHLPHNAVDAVTASRYKDVFRLALSEVADEGSLLSPPFVLVDIGEDPARAAARVPAWPCVVKPLSLSASRGVVRADDPAAFVQAFHEAAAVVANAALEPDDPGARQLLVEAFIPGQEVALEGLLVGGQLSVLALFDKPDPLDGPYFEETIYVTPSRLPVQTQRAIAAATSRAAEAIGLREGPIHAELRVNDTGAWVVELAARSIGGLCSNALRFGYEDERATSLEELILRQAARLPLPSDSLSAAPTASGVMMIPIPAEGRLHDVTGLDDSRSVPGVTEVTISIPCGETVVPVPRGDRYLGFIFARGQTPAEVESALRAAHAKLRFDIR